eukprot:scaffold3238_cov91-Cylindrotheca_fusiformis.AAC.7
MTKVHCLEMFPRIEIKHVMLMSKRVTINLTTLFESMSGMFQQLGKDVMNGELCMVDGGSMALAISDDGLVVAIGGGMQAGGHVVGVLYWDEHDENNWLQLGSDIDTGEQGNGIGHEGSCNKYLPRRFQSGCLIYFVYRYGNDKLTVCKTVAQFLKGEQN